MTLASRFHWQFSTLQKEQLAGNLNSMAGITHVIPVMLIPSIIKLLAGLDVSVKQTFIIVKYRH